MGTPQHPGFKKKHILWAKKKRLREWGRLSTLVLREKHTFGAKKKPLREWGHRNTLVLGENTFLGRRKKPLRECRGLIPWLL